MVILLNSILCMALFVLLLHGWMRMLSRAKTDAIISAFARLSTVLWRRSQNATSAQGVTDMAKKPPGNSYDFNKQSYLLQVAGLDPDAYLAVDKALKPNVKVKKIAMTETSFKTDEADNLKLFAEIRSLISVLKATELFDLKSGSSEQPDIVFRVKGAFNLHRFRAWLLKDPTLKEYLIDHCSGAGANSLLHIPDARALTFKVDGIHILVVARCSKTEY